jgi:hypothetical protein
MLRVVLPIVASTASWPGADIIAVRIVHAIRVVHEVIVVVDCDVIVATTPSAVIPPTATPGSPHSYADTERYSHSCRVISHRRIGNGRIRVDWRAVNHHGVITGNVHDLRVSLLNHDNRLALHHLRFHFLLIVGFQVSCILGLRSHPLHGIHYVSLLRQESVA